MDGIVNFLIHVKEFLNPQHLINYMLDQLGIYVYFGLFFVIFAETGLAVCNHPPLAPTYESPAPPDMPRWIAQDAPGTPPAGKGRAG